VNFILYNKFEDGEDGTASRSIDLPNGGRAYVVGNVIEKGPQALNSNVMEFGLEGLSSSSPHACYLLNNTIADHRSGGTFFDFPSGTDVFAVYNTALAGQANFSTGNLPTLLDTSHNAINTDIASFHFANDGAYDYHLTSSSTSCLNRGTIAPGNLHAQFEYVDVANMQSRCSNGTIDIGAFEWCDPNLVSEKNQGFRIFPNPAASFVQWSISTAVSNWRLVDLSGQLVLQGRGNRVEVGDLNNGVYLLELIGEEVYRKSIVVSH